MTFPYALLFYLAQVPITGLPTQQLQPTLSFGGWSKHNAYSVQTYSRYKNFFAALDHEQLAPFSHSKISIGASMQLNQNFMLSCSPVFYGTRLHEHHNYFLGALASFIYFPKENLALHAVLAYENQWNFEFRQLILLDEQWSIVGGWRPFHPNQNPLIVGLNFNHEKLHLQYLQQGTDWNMYVHYPYKNCFLSIGLCNSLTPLPSQWSVYNLP